MNPFEALKKRFQDAQKHDVQARVHIHQALADFDAHIDTITIRPSHVILTAKSKAAANELFLRREEIKKQLPAWVTELQVR